MLACKHIINLEDLLDRSDTSKWTVAFHIVEGKTKSNPFFSLIQKKKSRLGYDILSLHNGTKRGERAKWRTCVESKSNSEAFGALVCFNQRSPFILSYFIFHAGALLSSLQLKCFDHRQWDSAVGLGHLPFAHSCCHAGALGNPSSM